MSINKENTSKNSIVDCSAIKHNVADNLRSDISHLEQVLQKLESNQMEVNKKIDLQKNRLADLHVERNSSNISVDNSNDAEIDGLKTNLMRLKALLNGLKVVHNIESFEISSTDAGALKIRVQVPDLDAELSVAIDGCLNGLEISAKESFQSTDISLAESAHVILTNARKLSPPQDIRQAIHELKQL